MVIADDVGPLLARPAADVAPGPEGHDDANPVLRRNNHSHVTLTIPVNQPAETFGIVSAAITPQQLCNTAAATRGTEHAGRVRIPFPDDPFPVEPVVRRMDKRTDPWGDFLRRLLLSASLAGTALPAAAAEEADQPPTEVADAEHPSQPLAVEDSRHQG